MGKQTWATLALVLLLCSNSRPWAAPVDTPASTQLKQAVAKELASAADAADDNGLKATAIALYDEALKLTPDDKKLTKSRGKISGADTDDAASIDKYHKKADKTLRKAAAGYRSLWHELMADKDQATVDAWLERACVLDAEGTDAWIEVEYKTLAKDKPNTLRLLQMAEAHPLADANPKLVKARAAALRQAEADVSCKSPIRRKCREHTMQYYLSLPAGWAPDKKYPVYVACEGAGCNFEGACRGGMGSNNAKFIVLTPIGFTNTNALAGVRAKYPYPDSVLEEFDPQRMSFDEPGLLAAIKDVQDLYGGQDKVCITGFSGGGNLCWRMVFGHPDLLVAAVPSCANFASPGKISDNAEAKKNLVIRAFQGDKDEYIEMLNGQWDNAKAQLEANGYANFSREMVPGVGHAGFHDKARDVFIKALDK